MGVIKQKQSTHFTMIGNKMLNDNRLTAQAKGVFCYLFSKPDSWNFSGDRIALDFDNGRKAIFSAMKQLEKLGYIVRNKLASGATDYYLYHDPDPIDEKGQKANPVVLNPIDGFGKVPKGQSAKKGSISNTDSLVIHSNSNTDPIKAQCFEILINGVPTVKPADELISRIGKAQCEAILKVEFPNVETFDLLLHWLEYRKSVNKILKSRMTMQSTLNKIKGRGISDSRVAMDSAITNGYAGWDYPSSSKSQSNGISDDKLKTSYEQYSK